MIPEYALKLLAPKTQALVRTIKGLSQHTVTPEDVAAALAGRSGACPNGLPEHYANILRAKWSGESLTGRTRAAAIIAAKALSARERWRARIVDDWLEPMARAALDEVVANSVCESCLGRGTIIAAGEIIDCPICEGVGHARVSDRSRAKVLNMDHATFQYQWHKRYQLIFREFVRWEMTGLMHVAERLGNLE